MHIASPPTRVVDLSGQRVLVVEDEALVAMLIEDSLLDAGAKVVGPANTVERAMALVDAAMADGGLTSAVLDMNLSGERVQAVADKLASFGVPFVFATGYGSGCDTGGHSDAPMIHKPFSLFTLTSAIAGIA